LLRGVGFFAVALAVCGASAARADVTLVPAGSAPRWVCGAAPDGWQRADADESLFAERAGGVPDAGVGCARTQLLRWHFIAPADLRDALLTLRARYQHGFVAYLDGVEVARRRLPPDAGLDTFAADVHGPEWEHIPLPLRGIAAGPHVLAVEVHPRSALHEAFFDAELIAQSGPRLLLGPYLVSTTTHSAQIAVETDVPTTASLSWGTSDALAHAGEQASSPAVARRHVFLIHGLRAATRYAYRVQARLPDGTQATESEIYEFHTPPNAGQPLRFVIYGDVRSGHDVHADIVAHIRADDPDLGIMTGDLVDMGSDEADWDRYFEIATPLLARVPVYPAPGNHEYARGGRGKERFLGLFHPLDPPDAPAWRSFDVAGVHFIALDSNQYRVPAQLEWLKADLLQHKNARATIAYAHEGAYSSGLHGDNELAKAEYAPLLARAGVTLYVSGHDHHYERGRVGKLEYIVSGGGGAELRSQRCGVPGRKPCPPRVEALVNEHHYIVVEILPGMMRMCPKRPDGSALEACITRPLR
jgi:predicted MPP superfamily phosphohydrolase